MNKEELEQKIKSLLAKMADHSSNSNLNDQVEMGSLSEDVRELQEAIVILNHLNSTEMPEARTIEEPEEAAEKAETVLDLSTDESAVASAKEEAEAKVEEPTENDSTQEEVQGEDQEQHEPEVETVTESVTTDDTEPVSETSLNDQLESQSDGNSVASQLESQPIVNLSSAIGINERFLFTKELFNDDSQAYSAAIEKLNEFNSVDEARSYIESDLKGTYSWDDDSEAVSALCNLVEKRYSS